MARASPAGERLSPIGKYRCTKLQASFRAYLTRGVFSSLTVYAPHLTPPSSATHDPAPSAAPRRPTRLYKVR